MPLFWEEADLTTRIQIVPENPFEDGVKAGKKLGKERLRKQTAKMLADRHMADTLGDMSRKALATLAMDRLHAEPDYRRYPELEDIYPERLEYLKGLARGAECRLQDAAVHSYAAFRTEIETWHRSLQVARGGACAGGGHCSGVFMVGPDGVLGAHSAETVPPIPKPGSYRFRRPAPHGPWRANEPVCPRVLRVVRPRTGYISQWGVMNEKGVGCCAGVACSTWLDDPIEDTWPIGQVPLLRFAASVKELEVLYRRYTLHNWGRASQVWADVGGDGIVVEKSFRRIGVRRSGDGALWCTEGYWHTPEMFEFQRSRRLQYIKRAGKHLGADDMQYFTDCAVRFTRMGETCHEPLGRGYRHMNRVLTDHATFPRAVCRHGGPDTAPYDKTVTMVSSFEDLTHNRAFSRGWIPWKKFPCEMPWTVTQYPLLPNAP